MMPTVKLKHVCRVALLTLCALPMAATSSGQKTFASPDLAVEALLGALTADDDGALVALFGHELKSLILSPDHQSLASDRRKAAEAMRSSRRLVAQGTDRRVLLIGEQAWPLPVPLMRVGQRWRFATAQGKRQIMDRWISANERSAIQVLRAYVNARRQYEARDRDGGGVLQYARRPAGRRGMLNEHQAAQQFARRLVTRPTLNDRLYWSSEPESELGASSIRALVGQHMKDLRAEAADDAYHGYHFHTLTPRPRSAPGRTYGYVMHGGETGAFAMVAYPARHARSGSMSFIVGYDGTVLAKDLGSESAVIAAKLSAFNPGPGWAEVKVQ